MQIHFDSVSIRLSGQQIVHDLDLTVAQGKIVGLVGPNGSGKSTALRCAYRALRPSAGVVRIGGDILHELHPREGARRVAALAQNAGSDLDFTVRELVALGRVPHQRTNAPLSARDQQLCETAMANVDVLHLADRGVLELSGGELQRVLIARALTQEPSALVLDEPTNHLDVRHQIQLLSLVRSMNITVLLVIHDLNLAAAACDEVAVLSGGHLVAMGPPREVLTPSLIRQVFQVDTVLVDHPLTGDPQILFALDNAPHTAVPHAPDNSTTQKGSI
jgi:iron complex transport system ATP-binding protein